MSETVIVPATAADLPAVLALNEGSTPHVSSLTLPELRELFDQACYFGVVRSEGALAGFLLAMAPGQSYRSLNYRWFSEHYHSFVYVDRIVVAEGFRGKGIGRLLYEDVELAAGKAATRITCEVNLIPPNPDSIAFHHRLGFREVGQQDTEGGAKRVSLLAKPLQPEK